MKSIDRYKLSFDEEGLNIIDLLGHCIIFILLCFFSFIIIII